MKQTVSPQTTKKRTIFITSFFGLIARNILATDVLKILSSQPDLRIVILAPEKKQALYQSKFGSDNIIIEGIAVKSPSRLEIFFSAMFLNASDTSARKIHRLSELKQEKRLLVFLYHYILAKLGRLKLVRILLRWLDCVLMPKNRFKDYFNEYKPDLVFSTDIFEPNDIDLVREARAQGITNIGMIRSWDNITTKGLNRIVPDKLIVNAFKIHDEAVIYNDIDPKNIFVVGIPHYDKYVTEPRLSRQEFFKQFQLDPNKKTIFFAPPSNIYAQDDAIAEAIVKILMPLDAQLLLRLYLVGHVNLGSIKPIPNKIAIDAPASGSDFIQADLTSGDAHLADLLYYSDVVVAFASTLAIDAIVFNKPVVFIGFDIEPGRPYHRSLRRFYDYDHQRSILSTGGVKLANTPSELVEYVKKYLANQHLDETGREEIRKQRCHKLDGQSSQRLAQIVIELLRH